MRKHEMQWWLVPMALLFIGIGALALVLGRDDFGDIVPQVLWSTCLVLGGSLLMRSASEQRSRDEIGAEGGEDREVEQASGSHDG